MSIFRFKQFEIQQSENVFKVGTDAVLLGALVGQDAPVNALEIGSGTGIVSLMLAQRFTNLSICALDISSSAFNLTSQNFEKSPFFQRLDAIQADATSFIADHPFEIIVSNPPYFNQSTLSSTLSDARHTLSLAHEDLVKCCAKNLAENGSAWIILPPKEMGNVERLFAEFDMHPQSRTFLRTRPDMPTTRIITSFVKSIQHQTLERTIHMRNENHEFSSSYIELTRDFHPFF
jgi:tRNA1Val (adenine37-N6)-methyltransferase